MTWGREKRTGLRSQDSQSAAIDGAFTALRDELSDCRQRIKAADQRADAAQREAKKAGRPRPPTPRETFGQRSALVQPFVQAGYGVFTSYLAASLIPLRWEVFWQGEDVRWLASQALIAVVVGITMAAEYPKMMLTLMLWIMATLGITLYVLGM
jgi:hypothetical protein